MPQNWLPTDEETLGELASIAQGTPYYLASTTQLRKNMRAVVSAMSDAGVEGRLAYSVKSNYLREFIDASYHDGHLIEVVSPNEYALVTSMVGVSPADIVINGPGKSLDFILTTARAGATVNLDSIEEVLACHRWAVEHNEKVAVGLRVAATLPGIGTSRFGVDVSNAEVAQQLRVAFGANSPLTCTALHIHHSTKRDAKSFVDRVHILDQAVADLGLSSVRQFDIGGGFPSDPPPEIKSQLSYEIDPITECVGQAADALAALYPNARERPLLVVEPGLGVLADTMAYICRVSSIKPIGSRWAVIVDGSMFEVNPFRGSVGPLPQPVNGHPDTTPTGPATLYGSTCMEIDQLGNLKDLFGLKVGDLVLTANVGAYATALAPEFIFQRAPVIDVDSRKILRLRQEEGLFTGSGV